MMPPTIHPTIGRKAWYWPEGAPEASVMDERQACDATVIFVWNDEWVNLRVTDHRGLTFSRTSVRLHQGPFSERPRGSEHATWMPYQQEQAAKQANA